MSDVQVVQHATVELRDPVLIEGLPGVGNVGKLAADHMIEALKATKLCDVYSSHYPPQALLNPDGTIRLVRNELYAYKRDTGHDVLLLIGDYQPLTAEGQYRVANALLDLFGPYKPSFICTLGGYGTGNLNQAPRVLGAATDVETAKQFQSLGVVFSPEEPAGGIVGASGLLLGLAQLRSYKGVCLMGETSGYLVDPRAAKAVLDVLCRFLDIEVDVSRLDDRAKQMDRITQQIREMEQRQVAPSDEDLRYIG